MKRLILSIVLLITALSCSTAQTNSSSVDATREGRARFATLPKDVSFAGERVPLEYSDVREMLSDELVVVMNMHTATLQTLSRTTRYFPIIEPILKQHGVPNDFKYLAMTESRLNPNALSPAGASGLWQFMPATGREYGMETGSNIDMRFNVELATHAACRYFKKAYARFGSWTLAAASYNMGIGGLNSRITEQGVKSYYDLHLPTETMRYLFNIIAFKIIEPNPSEYGFDLKKDDYHPPVKNFSIVTVKSVEIDWSQVARDNRTNYRILRILNPWIRSYNYKNPKKIEYKVAVPTGKFRELGY